MPVLIHCFLFLEISIYLSIYLSICLSIYLSSIYLPTYYLPTYLLTYLSSIHTRATVCICVCAGQRTDSGTYSFLPLCESQGLNSDHQAWWQMPLPAKPSHSHDPALDCGCNMTGCFKFLPPYFLAVRNCNLEF